MVQSKTPDASGEIGSEDLRSQVTRLERERARLEEQLSDRPPSALAKINHQLMEQLAELEENLATIREENRNFAGLYVEAQEQNEAVTNLYVASHRLHATLDPKEVMQIITEILVELVGAEEFGILLLDERKSSLELVAGEGVKERLPTDSVPAGEGVIGEVSSSTEPFFFEHNTPEAEASHLPLAAIPLIIKDKSVGVIVIYKLLSQKAGFSPIDHQLLQLLAAHAATALVLTRLHSAMDRKLKTIEGFIQLMRPHPGAD
jgi:nitrate/nitrite-specific signal transduction histidine kinase